MVIDAYDKFEPYRSLRPLGDTTLGNCDFEFGAFEKNPKAASWIADAQRLHAWHMLNARVVLEALLETDKRFQGGTIASKDNFQQ